MYRGRLCSQWKGTQKDVQRRLSVSKTASYNFTSRIMLTNTGRKTRRFVLYLFRERCHNLRRIITLEGSGDKFLEFWWSAKQVWEFLERTPDMESKYFPISQVILQGYSSRSCVALLTNITAQDRFSHQFCCFNNLRMNSSSTLLAQVLTSVQKETIIF